MHTVFFFFSPAGDGEYTENAIC